MALCRYYPTLVITKISYFGGSILNTLESVQIPREVASIKTVVDTRGSRYEVMLSKEEGTNPFIVSVINLYVLIETINPLNCGSKLMERGMASADALSVEEIISTYFKQFIEENTAHVPSRD